MREENNQNSAVVEMGKIKSKTIIITTAIKSFVVVCICGLIAFALHLIFKYASDKKAELFFGFLSRFKTVCNVSIFINIGYLMIAIMTGQISKVMKFINNIVKIEEANND